MSSLIFVISGLDSLLKLSSLPTGIKGVLQVTMHQTSRKIENYMKRSMLSTSLSDTGNSLPGGFPAVKTGNLYSSVKTDVNSWDELEFGAGADYAKYLDSGTSRMLPRPFIELTGNKFSPILERAIESNLRKAFML